MEKLKPGPLSDITVLDFTWVLAGPHASKTLADMGANVIKVEQYKAGANERWLPLRITKNDVTQSSYTITVNRGKRSICVNMKTPKGMQLINELVKKSDVLLENFAPGVMERLKLDYDSVKKIKKDIIYCSISGYGQEGPFATAPAYDGAVQAVSGLMAVTGQPDGPPTRVGSSIVDLSTAMMAAFAIA
jgi:CoA:oxalate CoA-transferase